jgi:hypothetical protein
MDKEPIDWDALGPRVHRIKEAALEAMDWIDEPFSAVDLDRMHENPPGLESIAYHLRVLALRPKPVLYLYSEEAIRGAKRKLYFFFGRTPASAKMLGKAR